MRTAQQLFDEIVTHLRKQAKKALRGRDCVYRAHDGTQCAFGCLIPLENYSPCMEGNDLYFVVEMLPSALTQELEPHTRMLVAMQTVHDYDVVLDWESGFQKVAVKFGLTYTAP